MNFLKSLAPEPRRRLRLALEGLEAGAGDCLALREQFAGYHRLRVGGYRVIFRYRPERTIECVYAKERSFIYQLFEQELMEHLRHESRSPLADRDFKAEESSTKYRRTPHARRASRRPSASVSTPSPSRRPRRSSAP
jgi:mRNA-degrading endonuclease RelE of RelBE toxin-antitoxin system